MRPRQPGFYVSVRVGGARTELFSREMLDGPWLTEERARRRADEIADLGPAGADVTIVRVADDGLTILRDQE